MFDQHLLQDGDISKLAVDFSIIKHNEYKAMNYRRSLNAEKTQQISQEELRY